ncbi:MAG: sulfur carrier protein ThiS [Pseudomonadota bacterium]
MSKTKNASMTKEIAITLNGDQRYVPGGLSIAGLLAHLGLVGGKVAVERNKEIAPRSRFSETIIKDGDAIEIVRFVGGG